ncbi:MAG: hypothetical protein V3T33_08925 [Myxococcota bacterium]
MLRLFFDGLSFSSLWIGLAAALLCWAASLSLGLTPVATAIVVAMSGTIAVYNLDRLLDLDRDHLTTPLRSEFVSTHSSGLWALTLLAAGGSLALAVSLGWRPILVLAPALLLGLAHRHLKRLVYAKAGYVSAAWLAVVIGLPALSQPDSPSPWWASPPLDATRIAWVAAILGCGLFANAIASNLRYQQPTAGGPRRRSALWIARGVAFGGILVGAIAPAGVRILSCVPLATLAVLLPFRPSERYGLIVVDGALVVGASLSLLAATY